MKHLLSIFIALAAFSAVAVAHPADYKLKVQPFCELTVVDGIGVDCYCVPDSAGWAVFTCEPELASRIMFNNNAQALTVQTDAEESAIAGLPRIKLYTATLTRVENSGDSLVRIYAAEPVKSLKAKQIGNGCLEVHNIDASNVEASVMAGKGQLSIEGSAQKATLRNVSTGPIDASRLSAREINCFILGTGDINCSPVEKLKVVGAGSGMVIYHNEPAKITNRGIGVKVRSAAEEPSGELAANR